MELLLQNTVNGLTTGGLYACIAIGFTLIFGIVQLIYFAQCEMAMVGAFSFAYSYLALGRILPPAVSVLLALLIAAVLTALVSCVGQRVLLQPLRNAPKVKGLIASLGLSIVLQNVVALWISPDELRFPFQTSTRWVIHGVTITAAQLTIAASVTVVWLAVWAMLYRTSTGRTIRAVAQSPDGALLMGIRTQFVIGLTFAIAAGTAAVAGILMGFYNGTMRFDMGFLPGIKGFTVAILGGVGNIRGALLAGLCLGLAEGLFAGYISSDYRDVLAFGALIALLLIRPKGILGEKA